ncbi:MAG: FkbM family methyltransferase [Planctomycetales bacterium]|nr:FkbM family methyltransferase [Planctomycetales bacterium]
MTKRLDRIRNSIREVARPIVGFARRLVTPAPPEVRIEPVKIAVGPAAGCQMLLPVPSDLTTSIIANNYERGCIDIATNVIPPDSVCFDIGGHYGFYSIVFAKTASSGRVITFEPIPSLADRIRKSAAISSLPNLTVRPVAMAGEVGRMRMRCDLHGNGDDSMGYLESYGGVKTERSELQYRTFDEFEVECVTLDSLDLPHPKFIKIDAEGAEVAIIEGGRQLMSTAKPRLLIELHGVDLALRCATILGSLGFIAIATNARSLTMPVLWLHRDDHEAMEIVRDHYKAELNVLYGDWDGNARID